MRPAQLDGILESLRDRVELSDKVCSCGAPLTVSQARDGLPCDKCEKQAVGEVARLELSEKLQRRQDSKPNILMSEALTPRRYQKMTRETWVGEWPSVLDDWLEGDEASRCDAVFFGAVGTGKSHLATALLAEFMAARIPAGDRNGSRSGWCLWVSASGLIHQIKSEFNRGASSHGEGILERAIAAKVLLLDDLLVDSLKGDQGAWRRDQISYLLRTRYDNMTPTILTTNNDPTHFGEVDSRIASRLFSGIQIKRTGKDCRVVGVE